MSGSFIHGGSVKKYSLHKIHSGKHYDWGFLTLFLIFLPVLFVLVLVHLLFVVHLFLVGRHFDGLVDDGVDPLLHGLHDVLAVLAPQASEKKTKDSELGHKYDLVDGCCCKNTVVLDVVAELDVRQDSFVGGEGGEVLLGVERNEADLPKRGPETSKSQEFFISILLVSLVAKEDNGMKVI